MTSGSGDVSRALKTPSPRWWRPFKDLPLIILAIASVAAAIVGWTAGFRIDHENALPAPVASAPASDAGDACRQPLPARTAEPWIDADPAAAQTWEAHAADLGGPVVLGRDGWAFYNDQIEQNFSQTIGRRYLTVAEVTAWHDYFASIAEALKAQGIQLSIQITPSAGSVYPDMLPEWADGIQGSTPLDQLLAASPDLPIVDFRAPLRAAAKDDAVYTPVNSHWTDWGGYIGWKTFAECQAQQDPDAPPLWVPSVDGVTETGIFNEYASYGVPDAEPRWTAPSFSDEFADVQVTDASGTSTVSGATVLDLSKLPASTVTENARTTQTALILRDSMGNALSPYWQQQYAKTWQIQHRFDDWSSPPNFRSLVDQYHPNVVIIQLAERHLVNAPKAPSGY